jgi:AcrR family transcriptional regulator
VVPTEGRPLKPATSPRMGRPRSFDRAQAVARAMELFWALGYEGTTLTDLQQTMGDISAPSFYAAFGSKEQLFRDAVEFYTQTHGAPMARALEQPTAQAAIQGVLRAAATSFCLPGKPRGCLVVLGAINCANTNKGVQDFMRGQRVLRHKVIRERLQRGVADGDLPPTADLEAIAAFYITIIDGLAIEARDGASRKSLRTTVDNAMAAWDILTSTTA